MSAALPRFPKPAPAYDSRNEAEFRRMLAAFLTGVRGLNAATAAAGGATVLDDLTDVDGVTGLASGKYLRYNGTLWVPAAIAESDVTNLVTDLAAKAPLASPTFTGDPKAPTPAAADNDTSIPTTAWVQTELGAYAKLASPALTGNPTAPTPAAGDNDTSIPTTAWVQTELAGVISGGAGYGSEQAGTADIEVWYVANMWFGGGQSTFSNGTGTLRLVPFIAPARGGTLDRIAFEVTTNASFNMRIGLYSSKGQNNIYPDALLEDSGDFDCSAGSGAAPTIKSYTISRALTPGKIYWLAFSSSGGVVVRSVQQSTYNPILGQSGGTGATHRHFLTQTFTHGSLPGTISAGATKVTGSHPAGLYRFSA